MENLITSDQNYDKHKKLMRSMFSWIALLGMSIAWIGFPGLSLSISCEVLSNEACWKEKFATTLVKVFVVNETNSDNWKPLKNDENDAVYFVPKALFVLDILTFLSWFFCFVKKRLNKKATGQQIVTIHILLNISRSKGNQAMKFG